MYENLTRNLNGSYTFIKNGLPYNCPNFGEWTDEFAVVDAFAQAHPENVRHESLPPEPTLDELKAQKKAEIAAARYAREIAGTTVNGITIDTGRNSQALITGAALAAVIDSDYSLNWKTGSGFIHLTAPEIIAVAQAVRAHVQSCFDREGELVALVDAAQTAEELDAIEVTFE